MSAVEIGLYRGLAVALAHAMGHQPHILLATPLGVIQPADPLSLAAARMRNRAAFLAVTGFGVSMQTIVRETGQSKQAVSKALRHVEQGLEDRAVAALMAETAELFGVSL